MKLHVFAAAAALSFAGGVSAEQVTWNSSLENGTYDLNAVSTWSIGRVPTSADTVVFPSTMSSKTYTFTASGDLHFERFSVNPGSGSGNHVTLDLGTDRVMTLTGVENASTIRLDGKDSTLWLKSGTITQSADKDYPRYFMANINQKNNQIFIDGPNSKMILDAIKPVSENSLFCVTNGGYVRGVLLASQIATIKNSVIQVTGEGSMWDLGDNPATTTIDQIKFQRPLMLAHNHRESWEAISKTQNNDVLLKVDNKGVVTNFAGYVGGFYSGAKVIVDDATVYGRDAVNIGRESISANNTMEIRNGGLLTGIDQFHVGQYGKTNSLCVSGTGSRVDCKEFYVGHWSAASDNLTAVTDGGLLKATHLNVFESGHANKLIISGVGSTGTCSRVTLGGTSAANGNALEVSGGGMLNVTGTIRDEAGKTISGFKPFGAGHHNRLSITGTGSRLEFINLAYAGESETATNNLIEVADGGLLYGRYDDSSWSVLYLNNCANNTIRVRDGGKFEVDQFSMGMTDGGENSRSNVLEIVGEDSIVNVRKMMYLNGIDNVLTISNGLLKVSTDSNAGSQYLRLSQADGRSSVLNLEGETPRIQAKNFAARNTMITFTIPEGGFAEGPIIKATSELTIDGTCSLEIVAEHNGDGTAVLMQCTNKALSIADSVIANARFTGSKAKVYRLVKSADGRQLLLKPSNGTLVIFR